MARTQTRQGTDIHEPRTTLVQDVEGVEQDLVQEDLVQEDLIEEVSIDGMCGVY